MKPHRESTEVLLLLQEKRFGMTIRVSSWLINHGYPPAQTAMSVVRSAVTGGVFTGTTTLFDGALADEYRTDELGSEWYVKFAIYEDGPVLRVYSCCWDGAVH